MKEGTEMKRIFYATMGVAAIMAVVAPRAGADLVLTLDGGANGLGVGDVIVADGQLAGYTTASGLVTTIADNNVGVGVVGFSGAVGVFTTNISAGFSKPVIGPPPQIDLFNANISGGAGSILVAMTDTGFSSLAGPTSLSFGIGGTTVGSVLASFGADATNLEFGSGALGSVGPLGAGAFSGTGSAAFVVPVSPFSMTTSALVTHTGVGATSFDASLVVPAPAALLLGAMGLGLVGWVRKSVK